MIRKSAFIGLTIALVAALVWLAMEGRKEEIAQLAAPPKQELRSVMPSATRALAPADLAVTEARMELRPPGEESEAKASAGLQALHHVTISNNGTIAYGETLLKFSYLARDGKLLEDVTKKVSIRLPPGEKAILENILLENVPAEAHRCTVRILYAEILSASPAEDPVRH